MEKRMRSKSKTTTQKRSSLRIVNVVCFTKSIRKDTSKLGIWNLDFRKYVFVFGNFSCKDQLCFFLPLSKNQKMGKFSDIVKSDTPTLVDFYATWCGPCQMMSPVLDRLKNEMGSQVRILKIDVDKNQEVADKFKVRGVPTFILFKKGEILWRQSGGMDINTLKNKIKQAI